MLLLSYFLRITNGKRFFNCMDSFRNNAFFSWCFYYWCFYYRCFYYRCYRGLEFRKNEA